MLDLLVFDLDGTLVDSRADITNAVNHALLSLELPLLSEEQIHLFVGRGVGSLIRSSLAESLSGREPAAEAERKYFDRALKLFKRHYSEHLLDNTVLFPDVAETVASFKSVPKAVITNKPAEYSFRILEGLKVRRHFAEILGGDFGGAKKPAPDAFFEIVQRLDVDPRDALMIGDSTIDIEMARNAGTRSCAVTYGFGHRKELESARPDYLIDGMAELKPIAAALGAEDN